MRKKLILKILGIFAILSIIYIASPKWGSFYNLILKQYKGAKLTEVSITNPYLESNHKEINCTDKDTIDKIENYLKKLKVIEIRNKNYYSIGDSYGIDLYLKKDDDRNIYNYSINMEFYDKNLKVIVVHDKYGFKNYKVINDKFKTEGFNFQYISNLIENKQ